MKINLKKVNKMEEIKKKIEVSLVGGTLNVR